MRKPNRAICFAFAAGAVTAIGLTATTAFAAAHAAPSPDAGGGRTWSVSPMVNLEGGHGVAPAALTDSTTGGKINCTSPFVQLNYLGGMALTHTLVTLKVQTFSQCTLPDGTAVTVTATSSPWNMVGRLFNSGTNLGVTTGRVRDVSLSFSSSSCSGVFDGTAAGANDGTLTFQYYNNPHWLIFRTWDSTLHAYNVSGCDGIFSDGDPVAMHAVFDATYLVITSP
jgi:hypothetical protein